MSDPQQPRGESDRAADDLQVVAFVREGRPFSSNKNLGAMGVRYRQQLAALYREAGGIRSNEHRYGVIYYLARRYNPKTDADAGNIAKRIWDALEGTAYDDDEVVRLQLTGLIETGGTDTPGVDLAELDLTAAPEAALASLLEKVDSRSRDLLYIEIGLLEPAMYVFNLAGRQSRGMM